MEAQEKAEGEYNFESLLQQGKLRQIPTSVLETRLSELQHRKEYLIRTAMDFVSGRFDNPGVGEAVAKEVLSAVYDLESRTEQIEKELRKRRISRFRFY